MTRLKVSVADDDHSGRRDDGSRRVDWCPPVPDASPISYLTINQPWIDRAVCWKIPDPETWWRLDVPAENRHVCLHCPVRPDCLQYALDHNEPGIWGGLSESERTKLYGKDN